VVVDTLTVKQTLYLDSFIRSLRTQNVSDRMVETYSKAVSQLATYLVEMQMPVRPEAISREHVESFIGHLLSKWKPAMASNRYRALQRYFKWTLSTTWIRPKPALERSGGTMPFCRARRRTLASSSSRGFLPRAFSSRPLNTVRACAKSAPQGRPSGRPARQSLS